MAIYVTYRRTSRLSMRIVKNGDVHVSAPIGMAKSKVEAFVNEHQGWIVEARKKTAERQNQRAAFYNQLPLTTKRPFFACASVRAYIIYYVLMMSVGKEVVWGLGVGEWS